MANSPQELLKEKLGLNLKALPPSPSELDILFQRNAGHYALDEGGKLIGLNLFAWEELRDDSLEALADICPDLKYLNLSQYPGAQLCFSGEWAQLEILYLSQGNLEEVYFKGHFPQLEKLDLSKNQLRVLSLEADMPALFFLDVGYNALVDFRLAEGFPRLQYLYLYQNQLKSFVLSLPLARLDSLNLANNQIETFSLVAGFEQLISLNLQKNQLKSLNLDLLTQAPVLEFLSLRENPLKKIPALVFDKGENVYQALKKYWQEGEKSGFEKNRDVKIVIIGNGRVGKTCLYKRLVYDTYNKDESSTDGIQILSACPQDAPAGLFENEAWEDYPKLRKMQLNIWDFGGQD
ncbi:MAG: hypothetical protein AAFU64_12885, partial [Bacteroidota bacterium]